MNEERMIKVKASIKEMDKVMHQHWADIPIELCFAWERHMEGVVMDELDVERGLE